MAVPGNFGNNALGGAPVAETVSSLPSRLRIHFYFVLPVCTVEKIAIRLPRYLPLLGYTCRGPMRRSGKREIEVKLRVKDPRKIRGLLRRIGAVPLGTVLESNILYDTPQETFRRAGRLLRLRIETPAGNRAPNRSPRNRRLGGQCRGVLTYKAPIRGSHRGRAGRRYKERQEIEVELKAPGNLKPILEFLGLRPGFRYEKFRTNYRLPPLKSLLLDLDETPIGVFLELEGSKAAIDRAARRLGYSPADYLTSTYWELFQTERPRRHRSSRDMIFSKATI